MENKTTIENFFDFFLPSKNVTSTEIPVSSTNTITSTTLPDIFSSTSSTIRSTTTTTLKPLLSSTISAESVSTSTAVTLKHFINFSTTTESTTIAQQIITSTLRKINSTVSQSVTTEFPKIENLTRSHLPEQTFHNETLTLWPDWEIWTVVPILSLIMIFIVLGNLLVVIAILTQKSLRTPHNIYILSLALTDLFVGIFILPFNLNDMIHGWELGTVLCRIWLTSDVMLCSSSILHISAIAVDRFRSINEGLSYAQSRTIRSSVVICAALWFLALWIASPPVLGWNDWEDLKPKECRLTNELGYIIHSATGAFFIPAFVMVGLYFRIFYLLRKKFRERAEMKCLDLNSSHDYLDQSASGDTGNHSSSVDIIEESDGGVESSSNNKTSYTLNSTLKRNKKIKKTTNQDFLRKPSEQISAILKKKIKYSLTKERKAARTLGCLIGGFLLCWTPFTLTYLYSGFGNVNSIVFQFVTWLGYVNSAINPVVYTVFSEDFKKAFQRVLLFWRY